MIEGTPSAVSILLETQDRDNKTIRALEAQLKAAGEDRAAASERLDEMSRLVDVERARAREAQAGHEHYRGLFEEVRSAVRPMTPTDATKSEVIHAVVNAVAAYRATHPTDGVTAAVIQAATGITGLKNGELYVFRQFCASKGGVVRDGDLASKAARDELLRKGLVQRTGGFNALTIEGLMLAIESGEFTS